MSMIHYLILDQRIYSLIHNQPTVFNFVLCLSKGQCLVFWQDTKTFTWPFSILVFE